jgi:C1A family cysteine protease
MHAFTQEHACFARWSCCPGAWAHADGVVVVGYGDYNTSAGLDYDTSTEMIPYFLIRNSWGADWPAPPYGTVSYCEE